MYLQQLFCDLEQGQIFADFKSYRFEATRVESPVYSQATILQIHVKKLNKEKHGFIRKL